MNIIDILIIILIILGFISGFKRGFTNELVSFVGFALVFILSYALKGVVSNLIYSYLPFISFGNILKGASVLNILIYEVISFCIVFALLMLLFKILLKFTRIFEKILNATIILGIPSKIAGAFIGSVEYFILVFIFLYVLALPICVPELVYNSKYGTKILNDTPILNNLSKSIINITNDFMKVKDDFENESDINKFNLETLDTLLEYKIVNKDSVEILVEKDKINIKNIDSILNKY